MIKMNAQIYYGVNTLVSGNVEPVKDLISETIDSDEYLWENLSEQLADEELVEWLSTRNLSPYIVDVEEDEAFVSETGSDYVMVDVPFSFDEEKARQDLFDLLDTTED